MLLHALDRVRVEEVRRVRPAPFDDPFSSRFGGSQRERERSNSEIVPLTPKDEPPGQAGSAGSRSVLEREQHLEEGVPAQISVGLEVLDQLLKGKVLVGVSLQGRFPDFPEQLPKAGITRQIGPDNQGVHEHPNQALDLAPSRPAMGVPTAMSAWPE